jgi:glycosyltransferase involved in cell wall biosynthesis
MSALRIGYDVTSLGGQRTGVGNYTDALLRQLVQRGGGCEFRFFSCGRGRPQLELRPAPRGATVGPHRHVPVPARAMFKLWDFTRRPRVDALLGGVDIFHATNYYLPPVAHARRVVNIYDLAFLKHPEWCSPKIVGPFSRGVRRFAHAADAIVVCSEATRRDVVELLGVPESKVQVVYGAMRDDWTPLPTAEAKAKLAADHGLDTPFILYAGTLEPRKNIEGILQAFAEVQHDVPHALVLAGGAGWGVDNLAARIDALGITPRVRTMGYVDVLTLQALYAAASVFFFPSHYEGFGLPVLEAMASGCPVITARSSSLPEVGGDAARYVDPADILEMAGALRTVLGDDGLQQTMRVRGLAQARSFSWQASADRTLALYQRLS